MNYTPYYAPYARPMNYYNPIIPQEAANMQNQQTQQPMQMAQPAPMTNDMIWVLNETEATSYPVAPNNSVTLWDKNQDTVYIKSVNMQGVPSMRILDYVERAADNASKTTHKHECQCGNKFVSKDEFNALQSKFEALQNELEVLKEKPKTKYIKKSVDEVENDG